MKFENGVPATKEAKSPSFSGEEHFESYSELTENSFSSLRGTKQSSLYAL